MRSVLTFSAVLATSIAALPGAARATSTTCATTVVCAEYINTSSGVAIHGEANTGIGIRGTSVSNTGFYGASGSGNASAPGVEGESTRSTGSDAASAFGLAYLSGKPAPAYGTIAYGSAYGMFGEAANPGTSSSNPVYGIFGFDNMGGASADYNAGVTGVSNYGTGIFAEAAGAPTVGLVGSGTPIGLYAVGKKSSSSPHDYGIVEESDDLGIAAYNTRNNTEIIIGEQDYGLYGPDFIEGIGNATGNGTQSVPFTWTPPASATSKVALQRRKARIFGRRERVVPFPPHTANIRRSRNWKTSVMRNSSTAAPS